jgi:hypothetical protein
MTRPHDQLIAAIVENDTSRAQAILASDARLARAGVGKDRFFDRGVFHWLYAGDSYLHLAAAGHRSEIVTALLDAGADPNASFSRRRATPLHYAADGFISGPAWDPTAQTATLKVLLAAGANIDAQDHNGATPLHRAVRTRCAAAVELLLGSGCHATLRNKPGSTAFHLAVQTTGRGGSGDQVAHDAQRQIIECFLRHGVSTHLRDGRGASVLECAQRSRMGRELLRGDA